MAPSTLLAGVSEGLEEERHTLVLGCRYRAVSLLGAPLSERGALLPYGTIIEFSAIF